VFFCFPVWSYGGARAILKGFFRPDDGDPDIAFTLHDGDSDAEKLTNIRLVGASDDLWSVHGGQFVGWAICPRCRQNHAFLRLVLRGGQRRTLYLAPLPYERIDSA